MTDDKAPKGVYAVRLGDNPHVNGLQLSSVAEGMLEEILADAGKQAGGEVCEGCFWIGLAAACVLQAAKARDEHPVEILRSLAETMVRIAKKGQTGHICH